MKVCITATGQTLDSQIDPRFGRCAYFIFADTETGQFEAVVNPASAATGGAGVQAGQLVAGKDVQSVISGNVGPNAFQALQAADIEIIIGISGTVAEALEKYKQGTLPKTEKPNVNRKFGMGN